jgi:predicted RNA polymerase sigma factor
VLARRFGDFATAEDAVQEALLDAATQWPAAGLPDNPRGWLVQVAYRRMIELVRAETARREREDRAARREPDRRDTAPAADESLATDRDDTLVLLFFCCHPTLSTASAIALTLRAVGGLSTAEIARAFLNARQVRTWDRAASSVAPGSSAPCRPSPSVRDRSPL